MCQPVPELEESKQHVASAEVPGVRGAGTPKPVIARTSAQLAAALRNASVEQVVLDPAGQSVSMRSSQPRLCARRSVVSAPLLSANKHALQVGGGTLRLSAEDWRQPVRLQQRNVVLRSGALFARYP